MEDATLSPNAHMALLEGPEKEIPINMLCPQLARLSCLKSNRNKYLENISLIYGGALEVWGSQKHGPIQPKRPYKKTKTNISNNGKIHI